MKNIKCYCANTSFHNLIYPLNLYINYTIISCRKTENNKRPFRHFRFHITKCITNVLSLQLTIECINI